MQTNFIRAVRFGIGLIVLALVAILAPPVGASSPQVSFGTSSPRLSPPSDFLSGCTGRYFNNTDLSGSPALVRTDSTIDFYWPAGTSPGPGVNTSYYSVRWVCTIDLTTSGDYTLTINTDDGMNVLIDGTLVLWAWYDQGPTTYSNTGYLSAGVNRSQWNQANFAERLPPARTNVH